MKSNLLSLTLALLTTVLLLSCKSTSSAYVTTDVPFIVADHYFIKNDVKTLPNGIIDNAADFYRTFGEAAVMGGLPTPVNFKKQFAIAVSVPQTDKHTEMLPASLKRKGSQLIFSYNVVRGQKMSYSIQPMLLIIVDRKYKGETLKLVRN